MLSIANELENLVPEVVSLVELLDDWWSEEEEGDEGGKTIMLAALWLGADDGVMEWC